MPEMTEDILFNKKPPRGGKQYENEKNGKPEDDEKEMRKQKDYKRVASDTHIGWGS